MGTLRTSFAWLAAALTVGLVSGLPHVTLANDVGPGKEVRAIRHDLPILLSRSVTRAGHDVRTLRIDDVRIDAENAVVAWHDDADAGRSRLIRRYDRWWLVEPNDTDPVVMPRPITLTSDYQYVEPVDPYRMELRWGINQSNATFSRFSGRAPTEAESWIARDGNSYFFFSGTLESQAPVKVDEGTTIDVWFPFVLDPSLHYAITIGFTEKPIGPIDGTLKNNVVHFVLPAFTLLPGKTIMGEVEATSYAHY